MENTDAIYTENDVIRSKCLNDFSFFVRYFFKKQHGKKFTVNEHHNIMFDVAKKINKNEITRLLFNIAPRYSKTEVMVKMFIAWSIALNPKSRFIHLSYSDSLALDNSAEIKDIINSAEYQELFPYVKIKVDAKAKNKWHTTEGGGVLARSSAGQVTGFGAGQTNYEDDEIKEFGGAIIIDDPLKPDDAYSDVLRDRVNTKFNTTIRNRVNSEDTPIIIIMQRLHPNDLCGFLQENESDVWETISMPVISDEGKPLWEAKHNIEQLSRMREDLGIIFETQYMQNPIPDEGVFLVNKKDLTYYDELPTDCELISKMAFVDIADGGLDYHSVPIGYLYSDGKIYIEDVLFTRQAMDVNVPLTAEILNKHEVLYCRIETNFGGSAYVMLIDPLLNKTEIYPTKATTNKHNRIINCQFHFRNTFVFKKTDDKMYTDFLANLNAYQRDGRSSHDDAPDSLEGLFQFFKGTYPDLV